MSDSAAFSAVALFAEDARDELAGTVSLIGIMPDNILIDAFPAMLPRLHVYIRIAYDPADPPHSVSSGLRVEDQPPILANDIAPAALQRIVAEAVQSETRIGSIIARFAVVSVQLNGPCRLNATITWNGDEYIVGTLSIRGRG